MKRRVLAAILMMTVSFGAFAQKGKVSSAQTNKDSGNLEKAVELIDTAIDPANPKAEKTIPWAKTWVVRGEVYTAVFNDKDMKTKYDAPLNTALESYEKAIELDEKGQFDGMIKVGLTTLGTAFTNQAIECFNANDYKGAYHAFENVLEVNNLPIYKDGEVYIDTTIMYNAGLAAYQAEMFPEAIKYFEKSAEYGYMKDQLYLNIMSAYLLNEDTLGAITALQEGFKKYPEASAIVTNMVNLYIQTDNTDDAIKYLDIAIEQDPSNASFYFAQGALYDKLEDFDRAIASYNKAIELQPDFFDPYYNLGVIYFNKGVKQLEVANSVPTNDAARYEAEKKKANVEFEKAVPFMVKASEVNPKDTYSLESLKQLYYRLNKTEERAAVMKKLDELNAAQ